MRLFPLHFCSSIHYFTVDLGLYEYWGFRLDATPLFYFFSSPKEAVASVSIWMVLGGIVAMAVYAVVLYAVFYGILLQKKLLLQMKLPYRRLKVSGILLLMTGLLFIPIRGGFTVSTMNVGKVYFSAEQRLNHAAINPAFSLMESLAKQKDFSKQYRFMEAAEADRLLKTCLNPQLPVVKRKRRILCGNLPIRCILYSILSVPMYSL